MVPVKVLLHPEDSLSYSLLKVVALNVDIYWAILVNYLWLQELEVDELWEGGLIIPVRLYFKLHSGGELEKAVVFIALPLVVDEKLANHGKTKFKLIATLHAYAIRDLE